MIALLVFILLIASFWVIFTKAGQPGWASLIPFYNFYILCKITNVKNWWLIFIPLANIYIAIVAVFKLAKVFGKGTGFGFGLLFLGFIFYPILAFGDAKYGIISEIQADINAIGS
jgi:uncharacterized protein DUF5684